MLIENRLLTIAFAFALGVAVAGWERADIASVTILIAVFIFLLRTKGKKELILITAIFCFGIINYYISANDDIEFDIQKEQKSLFLKIITVESFSSEFSSYLARDIHDRLKIKENYLRLRMYHPKTTLLPGDTVLIEEARAYSGSGFNNIGLFNYREYLRDNSIAASIYPSKTGLISVVSSDNSILRELESIKMKMRSRLIFPESPDATAVAYALILADRGLLSNELRNVYTKSGLAHFLVVSGLHIGFIATFGYFLSRILIFIIFCKWKRHILESGTGLIISAIAAIGITILYTALTGFHLPATRAMVMIVVYLATLIVSRSRDFYQAFGAAMIVALLINPSGLFSASFLLSFNVVFFISIFITRYLKSSEVNDLTTDYYIQNRPFSERVRAIFPLTSATIGVSLAAFIAATPLVGYYFNLIPSYAFPLNSTITPLASILLPLGVAATILNSESAIWLFKTSIELLNSIATTVGTLKHGYINIPDFHPVALIFFYLFILIGLDLIDLLKKRVALFLTLLLFVASILTPIGIKYFDNRLIIRFLDVGQGFSAIASWKNGAFIIDGGANYPKFDVGENILAQALFNLGRTNLNAMFGSHGDIDHVGGFLTLYK
ncbi:MAG: ComEC/Rec2 family competence protein, partial [Nitrospinota bacterium]